MMCKPKDDLRKDCRLMEFNCLINKVRTPALSAVSELTLVTAVDDFYGPTQWNPITALLSALSSFKDH